MRYRLAAAQLLAVAFIPFLAYTASILAQDKIPRVGLLTRPNVSGAGHDEPYQRFVRTLAQQGWSEGMNVSFVYRSARGSPPQYDASAAELVGLRVDVIWAENAPATRAAYTATNAIPIVGLDFTNDPVIAGYAQSYARPGRNLTGFFLDAPGFAGKWLEQLKALIPGLSRVAVLWDPAPGTTHLSAVKGAARSSGIQLQVLEVHKPDDVEPALSTLRGEVQALLILPSPMTWAQSVQLARLTMRHRLPATSMAMAFAEAGGLLSYGPEPEEALDRCASLVSRILRGAKPGDLPVERPTKLPLIINLKSAKTLGLNVPDSVLVSAKRVIR